MSNEQMLFDIEPCQRQRNPNTCKTCVHIQRWACGGSFFFYCGARKSKRTYNKLLKVKCKNEACKLYKQKKKSNEND